MIIKKDKVYWGNNLDGRRADSPEYKDKAVGKWDWVYFAHVDEPRVLMIKRHKPIEQMDQFYYMDAGFDELGMTVFGYGREAATPLMDTPNTYTISLIESTDHAVIEKCIAENRFNV